RLELEAEHLREQLDEYKQYVTRLSQQVEEQEAEDVIQLEDLDGDEGEEEPFRLG
ncbi:MAG: CopG family transcriptional regulator, partial [Natronomonas sp.]|nr:CopG family transcriptional regulator [Natronomonas sp.]